MLNIEIEDDLFESFGGKVFLVDAEFSKVRIEDSEYTRRAMKFIDKAEYYSHLFFIDRFGCKQPIEYLSLGCKAALLVESGKCDRVHLVECGRNARDFIVCNASRGTIVMVTPGITVQDLTKNRDGKIEVGFYGKVFTELKALNDWVF